MSEEKEARGLPIHVLIFPAGAENRMDIYDSLRHDPSFEVFGASARMDHAEALYPRDHYFIGDLQITSPGFLDRFNELLRRFRIDYVIPTHDTVAVYLTKMADEILSGIVSSPYETARIAEDKRLTAEALKDTDYYPRVYWTPEAVREFPVFLKPWIGAGSRDTFLVQDKPELERILAEKDGLLVSEYLPGPEFTVSCFTDRTGKLRFAGASTRERIQNGRAFLGQRAAEDADFRRIAEDLNARLVFRGSWFFQVKADRAGRLKLLEISVRQQGEMALYRLLGVNFAALAVYDAMGQDVAIVFNDLPLVMDLKYAGIYRLDHDYRRVYLDAGVFFREKVDPDLIRFLYRTVNEGRSITCLSFGGSDLTEELDRKRIHRSLFSELLEVRSEEELLCQLTEEKAVFISGDRGRRQLVKESTRIPVFDLDALDCL